MSDSLNMKDIPVIDNHCHFFQTAYQEQNMAQVLSLSLQELPQEQLTNSLIYRLMLRELRSFLQVEGQAEKVLAAWNQQSAADYGAHLAGLFQDAAISGLIVDTGYKPAAVSLEDFESLVPCEVHYLYRIESVLDELWRQNLSLKKAEERFAEALHSALSSVKVVGLKSIIGYRTGIEVRRQSRSELKKGWPDEKAFRDYFLLQALDQCIELDIPMQIHASFGESNLNLLHNNPLLLKELLEDPHYQKARIVLVHGGYPYSFEAGYLAAMYPNVYLDISEMAPFVPLGLRKGLQDMMDMAPLNKIMYGSDGFVLPEIHWLAARLVKEEIGVLLQELISRRLFDEEYAYQFAHNLFHLTARQVYRLGQ